MTEQRMEELMVKVTDHAASPSEREELMTYLVDHPELRKELEAHQALQAVTDGWVQRLDADLAEDRFARKAAPRIVQRMGLVLLLLGFLVDLQTPEGALTFYRGLRLRRRPIRRTLCHQPEISH